MDTAHDLAEKFSSQPSLRTFQELVAEFKSHENFGKPSPASVEIYNAILQNRLVQVFETDPQGRQSLVELFSTPAGLSALVSRLNASGAVAAASEASSLVRILELVLGQDGIASSLLGISQIEATNLLFGSRILATVASKPAEHSWIGSSKDYSSWLAREMITAKSTDAKLFDKGVKLGAPYEYVAEYLKSGASLSLLHTIFQNLRPLHQRFVISHIIQLHHDWSPGRRSRLLAEIGVDAAALVHVSLRIPANVQTIRTAVVLAKQNVQAFHRLIADVGKEWGSKATIELRPLSQQRAMTQFLIAACASLDEATAKTFAHSVELSEGITNHFSSTSVHIRNLGTLVAETFAKRAGAKLEFGIHYTDYDWWIGIDEMDIQLDLSSSPKENSQQFTLQSGGYTELSRILEPPPDKDSDDEDEDESDNEEEAVQPFYIKDLVSYLRSDKYNEVYAALTMGAALIMRKGSFGTEVSHYSEELLRTTCALSDNYSIRNFASLKQSILDAVITVDPEHSAPIAVNLFVTGDWSLAQRQSLLTALVQAAHALAAGGGEREAAAQHEQLPGVLHDLFISPKDRVHRIDLTRGSTAIASEKDGELEESNVVRVSRRLQQQQQQQQHKPQNPVKKNHFSKVSNKFFFPLLAAQPPLRAFSYDAIVFAQWLRSLGVIAVEAYPSQYLPAMVTELWPLLKSLTISQGRHEVVIQEAIYSCLVMIISVGAGVVLQHFAADIGIVYDAVAESLGYALTPQTQKAGRAALAALADLMKQVQKNIVGL